MKKSLAAVLCAVALGIGCIAPAMAADSEFGEIVDGVVMTTARLAAFSVGAVVGTPIAIVRKTWENSGNIAGKLTGNKDNDVLSTGVQVLALPIGVFPGAIEGVGFGTANSWKNSKDKPFTKEFFSLGELKD